MHGAGARAIGGAPGDGTVQRPVHFERAGTVAIAAERGAKHRREAVAGQFQHLARGHVSHHQRLIGQRGDGRSSTNLARERTQEPGQGSGNALRSAAREWPAAGMRADPQHQCRGGAQRGFQGQGGMGGQSGEEGARAVAAKTGFRQAPGRANRHYPEPGGQHGMAGHAERRQHVVAQARPRSGEWLEEGAPGFAVSAQIGGRSRDGTLQHDGAAIVEGVGQRSVGVHPLEAVGG